ncbi:MAG: hypothetical protein K2M82_04535 [Lachnospiraceae bacterium]|nr:hypothetical protein [Lachnospiraceae bacterium]
MKMPDMALAVQMYYEKPELTSADIRKLFDVCATTATRLKKKAYEAMASKEERVRTWCPNAVNTKVAYEAWGINIEDYEARLKKLKQLHNAGVLR